MQPVGPLEGAGAGAVGDRQAPLQARPPLPVHRIGVVPAGDGRDDVQVGLGIGEAHGAAADEHGPGQAPVLPEGLEQAGQQRVADVGIDHRRTWPTRYPAAGRRGPRRLGPWRGRAAPGRVAGTPPWRT